MKIDGRAMALFNIKKEVYLVAILKLVAFWCSLFFIYNFVDFLFYSLGEESRSGAVLGFILDIYNFHSVVLYERTNTAKSFSKLSFSNKHFPAVLLVVCPLERDNNSVLLFY